MWLKFSWVLWLPGLRFIFVTPSPLSVPGPDTSLSVCLSVYLGLHTPRGVAAVPGPCCATTGRVYSQCWLPCSHSSASVCPGRKQLLCGGDEKSRANTFWISASGWINFNLNCHHKGPFFPFPFLWVVSLIYISEWGKWSPFGAKFSFFTDFQLQNSAVFLVNVIVAFLDLLGVFVLCCFKNQWNSMVPVLIEINPLVLRSS